MKSLVAISMLVGMIGSVQAGGYVCVGESEMFKGRIIATDSFSGNPATLTIEVDGKVIYDQVPVLDNYSKNAQTYLSLPFRNRNNVPAALYVQVYRHDGHLISSFSEVSYHPVVKGIDGRCERQQLPVTEL